MHAAPQQSAPDFIRNGQLVNAAGWVDVDKHTLRHVKYPNIFSLGNVSGVPTSKTGAAIRNAPVLVENLLHQMANESLTGSYNGYISCPLHRLWKTGTCRI